MSGNMYYQNGCNKTYFNMMSGTSFILDFFHCGDEEGCLWIQPPYTSDKSGREKALNKELVAKVFECVPDILAFANEQWDGKRTHYVYLKMSQLESDHLPHHPSLQNLDVNVWEGIRFWRVQLKTKLSGNLSYRNGCNTTYFNMMSGTSFVLDFIHCGDEEGCLWIQPPYTAEKSAREKVLNDELVAKVGECAQDILKFANEQWNGKRCHYTRFRISSLELERLPQYPLVQATRISVHERIGFWQLKVVDGPIHPIPSVSPHSARWEEIQRLLDALPPKPKEYYLQVYWTVLNCLDAIRSQSTGIFETTGEMPAASKGYHKVIGWAISTIGWGVEQIPVVGAVAGLAAKLAGKIYDHKIQGKAVERMENVMKNIRSCDSLPEMELDVRELAVKLATRRTPEIMSGQALEQAPKKKLDALWKLFGKYKEYEPVEIRLAMCDVSILIMNMYDNQPSVETKRRSVFIYPIDTMADMVMEWAGLTGKK